ncbi:hypothetical protein A8709_10250 [Paenibacillus pectinilyticus]|uniref:Uncharacterized protein n=1 Tax=Paenibacillus pectinilyticus TaxID=512399 RepID=A0A1C1A667_9BACL|nr:Ger(x)C family spore germination protein [Paenibacillus pectinilyticus]OCT15991.1 hypothetical protein A8709_10250 [Paenibacillus pectinilyticus]
MKQLVCSIFILLIMSGCWDQNRIKDLELVDVVGLDTVGKSNLTKMNLAISSLNEAHQGGGKPGMELITAQGGSVGDAIENIDYRTAGGLSFNQSRLYILSKSFAAKEPTEDMEIFGRVASCPLTSSVVVYDGEVTDLLAMKKKEGKTIANYLVVLLRHAESLHNTPKETLLRFIVGKADPYGDLALPLIKMNGDNIQLSGAALFREGKYSGIDLSPNLTKLSMLLKGENGTGVSLIIESGGDTYELWVKKASKDLHVKSSDNKVNDIILPLHIQAVLTDAGKNNKAKALSQSKIDDLERMLSEEINKQALQAIKTLQKANCDYLELAREIHAFHYKEWKQMNWREDYPEMNIRPEVKLQILNSGVML